MQMTQTVYTRASLRAAAVSTFQLGSAYDIFITGGVDLACNVWYVEESRSRDSLRTIYSNQLRYMVRPRQGKFDN